MTGQGRPRSPNEKALLLNKTLTKGPSLVSLQLMIILIRLIVWSIKCQKTVNNVNHNFQNRFHILFSLTRSPKAKRYSI